MRHPIARGILLVLLLVWASGALAQDEESRSLELDASIRYFYGTWTLGELDMDPVYGMIGPTVTARFWDRRATLTAEYATGDFEGVDRLEIPTAPQFASHKDYDHATRSEEFNFLVGFAPSESITLLAGYKYVEYDFSAQVKFNSNIREYGSGEERLLVNAKSYQVGADVRLRLLGRVTFSGRGLYMPNLVTESEGSFSYRFLDETRNLEEEWQDNGKADGFSVLAGLTYDLVQQPVSFSLGYAYQELEADAAQPTWFDRYTQTINPGNSFPTDTFEGAFFDIKFRF